MNGKIQVTGANGDGQSSLQHSTHQEFDNSQQYHDSNGSYVNRMMINGSAYNSPNLANNRRDPPIHERALGDGSLTNPDVIPSESFSSMKGSETSEKGLGQTAILLNMSSPLCLALLARRPNFSLSLVTGSKSEEVAGEPESNRKATGKQTESNRKATG